MRAVTFKWQSLSKEHKQPFEQIASEDKQRYDREFNDMKRGSFQSRTANPQLKLQVDSEVVSQALDLTDDILQFMEVGIQAAQQNSAQINQGDNNVDDLDELQAQEEARLAGIDKNKKDNKSPDNSTLQGIVNPLGLQTTNLTLNSIEDQTRKRLDSFMNPGMPKNLGEDQMIYDLEMQQQLQQQLPLQGDTLLLSAQNQGLMNQIQHTFQLPINQHHQIATGLGNGFQPDHQQRNLILQEGAFGMRDRLPSMNLGNGFGFSGTFKNPLQQSPGLSYSPLIQCQQNSSVTIDETLGQLGYLQQYQMGGLQQYQLPPTQQQFQQYNTFQQMLGPSQALNYHGALRQGSSLQMGQPMQMTGHQQMMPNYMNAQQQSHQQQLQGQSQVSGSDYSNQLTPYLNQAAAQQQYMFAQYGTPSQHGYLQNPNIFR